MRALGEFFGHVAHGVKTPVHPADGPPAPPPPATAPHPPQADPQRRVLRETVEEEERQTPQGKVTLRRTIIEEVELPTPPGQIPEHPSGPA